MAVETTIPAPYRASTKSIYACGVGGLAETFLQATVVSLVMPVFNTGFGMSAVMVGWAIAIPRFLDAVLDPLIGYYSDTTHSRWGRRRPYLAAGAMLSALITVGIWWAGKSWSPNLQFAYLLASLLLFWTGFSLYAIPLQALTLELTDDYHQRTTIGTIRGFFYIVPNLGIVWLYWIAQRPYFGDEINGMRYVSIPIAIGILLSALAPILYCKERHTHANIERYSFWSSAKSALANRYFRQLTYIRLANAFGSTLFGGMCFYINVYYICKGDKSLATAIGAVSGTVWTLAAYAGTPLLPWFGRRFDKRAGMLLGLGAFFVQAAVQPIIQTPAHPYLQLVGAALGVPSCLLAYTFMGSFQADICDLDELETGRRQEGVYSSVGAFINKAETSILGLGVGYLVAFSGFNEQLPVQPPEVLNKLRWLAYVPFATFSLLALVLAWRFPINQALMRRTRAALDARAASQGEHANAADVVAAS